MRSFHEFVDMMQHAKIGILWFWKEGISTLNFLKKIGVPEEHISIFDENTIPSSFWWKVYTGKGCFSLVPKDISVIFRSPGISPYSLEFLKTYSWYVFTQAYVFFSFYRGKVITVTQTKWKSTTVSLISSLLRNAWYNVVLIGNIGTPVFDVIDFTKEYDYVVYELSSYMLEGLTVHRSEISLFWNIYPEHLDWHGDFLHYFSAKMNITQWVKHLFIGYELYQTYKNFFLWKHFFTFWKEGDYSYDGNIFYNKIAQKSLMLPSWSLVGNHNIQNLAWMFAVKELLWIDDSCFERTLQNFHPLPHRMEEVGIYNGIRFINDALSTIPQSTIYAIQSFWWEVETIFLGWTDRGYDFSELIACIKESAIKNIVLFPDSWKRIKELLPLGRFRIFETTSMKEAVCFAKKYTSPGKICLLSTASPSYSLWKSYEEKWNEFMFYVKNV